MSVAPGAVTPAALTTAISGLQQLRADFDGSFGVPAAPPTEREPVLVIRAGNESFAVRAGQIAGLLKSRKIVPLPSRIPELLGVASLRGSLLPVYDLAGLLGIPTAGTLPGWLLLVPSNPPVGLAFDEFEGRQQPEWISDAPGERRHVRQLVRLGPAVCSVLDIRGLAEAIRKRAGLPEPAKEETQ